MDRSSLIRSSEARLDHSVSLELLVTAEIKAVKQHKWDNMVGNSCDVLGRHS